MLKSALCHHWGVDPSRWSSHNADYDRLFNLFPRDKVTHRNIFHVSVFLLRNCFLSAHLWDYTAKSCANEFYLLEGKLGKQIGEVFFYADECVMLETKKVGLPERILS